MWTSKSLSGRPLKLSINFCYGAYIAMLLKSENANYSQLHTSHESCKYDDISHSLEQKAEKKI